VYASRATAIKMKYHLKTQVHFMSDLHNFFVRYLSQTIISRFSPGGCEHCTV